MFPRMNITTPLPSFAYCPPQYSAGVGFGGINPAVPYMATPYLNSPASSPYPAIAPSPFVTSPASIPYPAIAPSPFVSSPASIPYPVIAPSPFVSSPASIPYPVIAPSPYALQPFFPYSPGQISAGISPISPISPWSGISPISPISPISSISPWHSPFSWSPYAFAPPTPALSAIHPALAASAFSSPVTCIDPITGAIVPQPYPAAQSLLPIRPLVATHTDPLQIAAMTGMMVPPMVDPYSVMAQMPPTMAVSPASPVMRSPLYMAPLMSPQVGVPYPVTAGLPC
ncbi:MAG: hypothetical protein J2P21_31990 [Chloracidobacterium sp.]|nr:hypothetical protein [Chloracidobacterium sp.]